MPVTEIPLDSSTREENVTLLHGKNLLLKLIENEEAKQIFSGKDIEQFLSTEDLCFKDCRDTMNNIVELERKVEHELERDLSFVERELFIFERRRLLEARHRMYPSRIFVRERLREALPKEFVANHKKRMNALMKRLQKMDRELLKLEAKIKEFNKNLEILYPTVLLRCSKCGSPILKKKPTMERMLHPRPEFDVVKGEIKGPIKCAICGYVVEREKALRTHLHAVKEALLKLWKSNLWLEDHISRLLRSMQWQTWSHVSVLGSSGVRHEVDVLGVKGSYVLVCECKTGHVSREDVFNFWAKVYDIRSHVSMLALIEQLPEPETKEFVAKNPSVFLLENLGEKKKSQIIGELEKGILGKI